MKKRTKKYSTKPVNTKLSFFLIPLVLAAFTLLPTAQAQLSPPPDGGYADNNTAEGTDALFSLTTGPDNTAVGFEALYSNTTGDSNTATGSQALVSNTTGIRNTSTGFAALSSNTTGERNTATGRAALANNTTGNHNTANGHNALIFNSTGNDNTATGSFALVFNTIGNQNIALGNFAGSNLTTGNNNIDIGNQGVTAEANTIRIGTQGTQTKTFIAGINGTGVMGVAVKINAAGQLGTASSSQRFKTEIKPMDKASEAILALKPVTFLYKKELDPEGLPQFGLVAEEVEKVNPALIARDAAGKPYTVRYDAVNAMLLNEFLKDHTRVETQGRKIEEQELTIAELKSTVAQQRNYLEATTAQQQKQIEALTTGLQKVNAQLELRKPASQMVSSGR